MTNAILKEEILKDEQLEQVAGGTYNNTAADTRVLQKMGFDIAGRSALELFWIPNFDKAADEVNKVMGQFGIHVDQSWGAKDNKYYLGDRQISRHEAFLHIAKATGQDMPDISY